MERILICKRPDDIVRFLEMEDNVYKNIIYQRDIVYRESVESDILKTDDGKLHYALNVYKIKKAKKYYLKLKSKKGFTLDEKGKISIWYGSDIASNPHFCNALEALNIDWFVNEKDRLWTFMTKTLFQKTITGKITNPIDYLSAYLKLSRIKASPKLLYSLCKKETISKISFLRGANSAKDVNHYIEFLLNINGKESSGPLFPMEDMIKQSLILERKIDYKWSPKRMSEEHTIWTKDLMEAEVTHIPDKPASVNMYDRLAPYIPDFFEPLYTQKRVFMEGRNMQHCVYTNYWNAINTGDYLAYHIKWEGQDATLGLYINHDIHNPKNKIAFSQLYGKRNSKVSSELMHIVTDAIHKLNNMVFEMSVSLIKPKDAPASTIAFLPF